MDPPIYTVNKVSSLGSAEELWTGLYSLGILYIHIMSVFNYYIT